MPYNLSVWLDDKTAEALVMLCDAEDRKRSNMVKVLIRKAAIERDLKTKNQIHKSDEKQSDRKPFQTT